MRFSMNLKAPLAFVSNLMFWGMSIAAVHAQTLPTGPIIDDILREQGQITNRDQKLRDELRERAIQQQAERSSVEVKKLERVENDNSNTCFQIDRIVFEGAKVIGVKALDAEVKALIGKCLTISDLQNVLRATTNYYIERGYFTSRSYLAPQDLSGGTLKVLVVEGRAEAVKLIEQGEQTRGAVQLFGRRAGRILNLRQIEQGLDQINRLGSKNAKIRVEPGKEVGTSIVYVDIDKTHTVSVSSEFDNYGSESTGRYQAGSTVTVEDVLGFYESFSFNARTSTDRIEDDIYSRSYSGVFSVPFQRSTLSLSGSYSHYRSEIESPAQTFHFDGNSFEVRGSIDHLLFRNQRFIWRGRADLTVKESRNFIEGSFIETSSQRLAIGELTTSISGQVLGGYGSAAATYKQGLGILGAQDDDLEPFGTPSAQFGEIELKASYQKLWQAPIGTFGLASNAFFSASNETLFASERISIGGASTVRGFDDDNLIGDVGGFGRAELSWSPKQAAAPRSDDSSSHVRRIVGVPQLFAGLDGGFVAYDGDDQSEGGKLVGAAAGLRLTGGLIDGEIVYERPLMHASNLDFDYKKSGYVRFRIGARLKF